MFKVNLFLVSIVLLIFMPGVTIAQESNNKTFIIKENSNHIDIRPYITAIEKADFNCYHLSKTRRVLTFDSGVSVELFSISEMLLNNVKINRNCVVDESQINNKQAPIYHLDKSGIIAERHDEGSSYQKH